MKMNHDEHLSVSVKRLATVKQVAKLYPVFTSVAAVRWLIFNERENGFHTCIKRIGRRVWIDLDALEEWINQH